MKRNVCLFAVFTLVCLIKAQSQPQLVFPDFHNGAVTGIDFSKNNKWILTGGADEGQCSLRQKTEHY